MAGTRVHSQSLESKIQTVVSSMQNYRALPAFSAVSASFLLRRGGRHLGLASRRAEGFVIVDVGV